MGIIQGMVAYPGGVDTDPDPTFKKIEPTVNKKNPDPTLEKTSGSPTLWWKRKSPKLRLKNARNIGISNWFLFPLCRCFQTTYSTNSGQKEKT